MGVERVNWSVVEPLVLDAIKNGFSNKQIENIAGITMGAVYYHAKHNPVFELNYANAKLEQNKKQSKKRHKCEYDCFDCQYIDCIR